MSDNRHKNKNPPSISEQSLPPITFTDRDFNGINPVKQDDPMVVSIIIANFMVSKVFIDQGNSTDILELAKPHPIATEGTQVMSVDEGPPIQALSVYQANLDDEFDVDP
ncbi:hypothetical protein JHK82_016372 [Glycine max]|nr:hypothetical protein JHK85_016785 [Glycine max]KAG5149491.1 hypothetical protein JHK82_016372 [Glycine max]